MKVIDLACQSLFVCHEILVFKHLGDLNARNGNLCEMDKNYQNVVKNWKKMEFQESKMEENLQHETRLFSIQKY